MRNGCPTAEIILTDAREVVKKKLYKWSVGKRNRKNGTTVPRGLRALGEKKEGKI